MIENMLDAHQLKSDLEMLHVKHGINLELIQSLTDGPKTARAHIRFFKIMMFLFNGAVTVLALALIHYGTKNFGILSNPAGSLSLLAGCVLLLFILWVYIRQVLAIKAVETVAKRHGLI